MPIIHFVETRQPEKDKCLCAWVEKLYIRGLKIQVFVSDLMEAQNLDYLLWVFKQQSFIPHKIYASGNDYTLTPVIISSEKIRLPKADALVMSRGCSLEFVRHFKEAVHFICVDDEAFKSGSRQYWITAKEQGFDLKHYPYRPLGRMR